MASKIPIPILTEEKNYERYKLELTCWLKLGELGKSKQGVALSLPEKHSSKIKDNVFNEMTIEQLSAE